MNVHDRSSDVRLCMHLQCVCVCFFMSFCAYAFRGVCDGWGIMLMGQMLLYLVTWEDMLCRISCWDSHSPFIGFRQRGRERESYCFRIMLHLCLSCFRAIVGEVMKSLQWGEHIRREDTKSTLLRDLFFSRGEGLLDKTATKWIIRPLGSG